MRRLVSGLLVCLTVCLSCCSPAMAASTSGSAYSMVPLSASDVTFSWTVGLYEPDSDSFGIGDSQIISRTPISAGAQSPSVFKKGSVTADNAFFGYRLLLDGLNGSEGSSARLLLNSVGCFGVWNNSAWPLFDPSLIAPFKAVAILEWSGTGKHTNASGNSSWISLNNRTTTIPVNVSVQRVYSSSQMPSGSIPDWASGRPIADYEFSWEYDFPKTAYVSGSDYEYEVVSATAHAARISIIWPLSNYAFVTDYDSGTTLENSYIGHSVSVEGYFFNADGRYPWEFYESLAGLGQGGQTAGLQQSISQLSSNVSKQIGELKTTIQQGANEVKNEIKSQTQTITDKLTAVKDDIVGGITDLKETTTQGFKDVVQGITDLPGKIGEMLQGLIVPDSEKVSGKFEDFNNLAEEKLGVIYQVPEMVIGMGQSIVSGAVEQKGEMTLPKFEIIMPATNQSRAGERLTVWEEYTFPIWPEGTEVIHTAVQTATSLVCVIAMINSIKRKYEEWLDGH